jgi:hypothetical protein
MTVGPRSPSLLVALLFQLTFRLRVRKHEFLFLMLLERAGRYNLHVLRKPLCTDPARSMDGMSLNLLNGNRVLIANELLPSDEEAAREVAKLWAEGYLDYITDGTPFYMPRDNDD